MSTIFADDHQGLKVCYRGLISKARKLINKVDPGLSEMLRQLEGHLSELGARWYAGDQTVVDEFLQLYTIQTEARQKTYALTWNGDRYDELALKRGMLHVTEENAVTHAKALIKVSGGQSVNKPTCAQCGKPAHVRVSWPTSQGPQSALLCESCSAQWWNMFKHTPAGQSAIFEPAAHTAKQ